jgi:hypothetical protein
LEGRGASEKFFNGRLQALGLRLQAQQQKKKKRQRQEKTASH